MNTYTMNWKFLLFSMAFIVSSSFATQRAIDKIAVIVNNHVILESEINNLMKSITLNAEQFKQQIPNNTVIRNQVIEHLIMDHIILQIGHKIGMNISDEQLYQALIDIAKYNNMTIDQMRNDLINNGVNYDSYCEHIRKEILISEIRNNEVHHRIVILPKEVDSLAKEITNHNNTDSEFNLSYIFIPLPTNLTDEQISKIKSHAHFIIEQARNGIDFAKLAITNSVDQQALKFSQLGWKHLQELPSIFTKALIRSKKDDIVGPIRSETGFHILKVNNLRNHNQNVSITEVYARHILLKPSLIMSDNQIQKRLEQIAYDINHNKITFANAAKKFSQDPNSANQGGELGWASINSYDPLLRNSLINLKKNQLSVPIHSSVGWHLIELLDIRNVNKVEITAKERAYNMLYSRKFLEESTKWMQEQRVNAYVKILTN